MGKAELFQFLFVYLIWRLHRQYIQNTKIGLIVEIGYIMIYKQLYSAALFGGCESELIGLTIKSNKYD